ncbi:hypothetical protein GCM10010912_17490 [Paenibacillus albidus]|uniref:Uncharacterized protein n=1 Tax=Paenibacillus albidus TaxID=2041023 RepID=A0A917FG68_9BACL|nr:hypothetical protein [Paenibacillus albidus]GGF72776.1 hypothetical protein GCM10010912_17490 [Paenibacillus albidus]
MKRRIIILVSAIIVLLVGFLAIDHVTNDPKKSAFERGESLPVPTGSVDTFEADTKSIIDMYASKSENLEPLTEEEERQVSEYHDKYLRNPRLTEEQGSLQTKVIMLENSYFVYSANTGSKKKEDIKSANEAITQFLNVLEESK